LHAPPPDGGPDPNEPASPPEQTTDPNDPQAENDSDPTLASQDESEGDTTAAENPETELTGSAPDGISDPNPGDELGVDLNGDGNGIQQQQGVGATLLNENTNPPALTGTVNVTPASGNTSTAFAFSANISGGVPGFTYAWDFGDGTTSAAATPTHSYAAAGSYTAKVLVTDSKGNSISGSVSVSVSTAQLPILGTYQGPYQAVLDPVNDDDTQGDDDTPVSGQVSLQITSAPPPSAGSTTTTVSGTIQVTGMPGLVFSVPFDAYIYDTSTGRITLDASDSGGNSVSFNGTLSGHTIVGSFTFNRADSRDFEPPGENHGPVQVTLQ
jgi:PKD repeat protein